MNETTALSGKLVRQQLPELKPGPGVVLPTLKRLNLPQGTLDQFHDSELSIHYIASLELTRGTLRGNHYHRAKVEHVYLMRGELEVFAEELDTGERTEFDMRPGDLIVIQPLVAHAFRVKGEGVAIEFAPTRFDPEDIQPHDLAG
jgi:mannose-6-phosphate isomerase-like protein (cupin superfamily)